MNDDFTTLVEHALVRHHGRTPEEAARLVDAHPRVVLGGVLAGPTAATARETAYAILLREADLTAAGVSR